MFWTSKSTLWCGVGLSRARFCRSFDSSIARVNKFLHGWRAVPRTHAAAADIGFSNRESRFVCMGSITKRRERRIGDPTLITNRSSPEPNFVIFYCILRITQCISLGWVSRQEITNYTEIWGQIACTESIEVSIEGHVSPSGMRVAPLPADM